MGEFDLSLIREFRSRPVFYDRNSPQFKDKVYTAHEWQVISNKLGYDVSLLKDRMLQLRNRYNLEKRRVEQYREENPGKHIESPWPLYNHLHFLSEHIRARRSYKRMMPMMPMQPGKLFPAPASDSGENASPMVTCHAATPFANGLLAVKMEEVDGEDNDTSGESDSQSESAGAGVGSGSGIAGDGDGTFAHPHPSMAAYVQGAALNPHEHSRAMSNRAAMGASACPPAAINIRRFETMCEATAQKRTQAFSHAPTTFTSVDAVGSGVSPAKRFYRPLREQKYEAFGNFLSSSLLELPPTNALMLVEKFTTELVEVLLAKSEGGGGARRGGGGETGCTNGDNLGQ